MKTSKITLAAVMTMAWSICRESAKKFGGSARQYLAGALKAAWNSAKNVKETEITYALTGSAPYLDVEFVVSKGGNTFVGSRYNIKFTSTGATVENWRNCKIDLDKNETNLLRKVFDAAFNAEYAVNDAEFARRAEEARKSEAAYNEAVKSGAVKHIEINMAAYNRLQNEESFDFSSPRGY